MSSSDTFFSLLGMLPRLWISLKNLYFRFCVSYAIQTPTRCKGFVFWLIPLVIRHILEGPVKSLICMDFMQFSTVVALDSTFSISNPTLELWELCNSASEASFARKMMRWHQPTAAPEPLNYWPREIKSSIHHLFYKYNHFCTHRWKVFFVAYCTVYCTVYCTAYCIIYCTVYTVLYTMSSILCILIIERQNRLFLNGNSLKDSPPMLKVMGH